MLIYCLLRILLYKFLQIISQTSTADKNIPCQYETFSDTLHIVSLGIGTPAIGRWKRVIELSLAEQIYGNYITY